MAAFEPPYTYAPGPSGIWEIIDKGTTKKPVKQTISLRGSSGKYGIRVIHDNRRPDQEQSLRAAGLTLEEVMVWVSKLYYATTFTFYLKINDFESMGKAPVVGVPTQISYQPTSVDPKLALSLYDIDVSVIRTDDVAVLGSVNPNSF